MAEEIGCNTSLELGLGLGNKPTIIRPERRVSSNKPIDFLDLSFTLGSQEAIIGNKSDEQGVEELGSNSKSLEENEERGSCKRVADSVNSDGTISGAKKLKLSKEQANLLENCFKVSSTLNPVQKQTLAEQLNLKPRQIEVWFQNRRARTKLKQTEIDYEYLKRCCQNLTEENEKLKRELQELRSSKIGRPTPILVHHVPVANSSPISTCPSCEKVAASHDDDKSLLVLKKR